MPTRPDVVLLDVNETLTDLTPLRERFAAVGAPGHLLDTWFAATLRDGFALAAAGAYAGFAEVARAVLGSVLAVHLDDPAAVPDAAGHVLAGLPGLDLHPDVPAGLRRLHGAGVRLATLTNGSAEMSRGAFARAGVLDLLDPRLSVEQAGRWKPAPEPYRWAAQVCGVPPARTTLVAVHPWDVDGAARAGLGAAWVDRAGAPYPGVFTAPDVSGPDLPAVAEALLALDPA